MQETVLALTDVAVAFGALRAVDGVSLTIGRGQRRAIIGPNGAGKTTLFNAITGVILASEGRVEFNGQNITSLPPHARAALGIARTFQITNLFPSLTVHENMILAYQGLSTRKFSLFGKGDLTNNEQAEIERALVQAGIADLTQTPVTEMSYGKQRQLEIALALVSKPQLLLLDEPAAGLSPSERSIVADVISNLPKSLTMILIEHDMDLALGLVDYVTCLHEGKILVEAPPDAIRTNDLVQDVYLGKPHHA
jgi:branched-chain amino acid transport system ATP-binding protein